MKINNKILSLPPYISTTWANVASLRMQDTLLVINLFDGSHVEIPGLKPETIETIFAIHAGLAEHGHEPTPPATPMKLSNPFAQVFLGSQQGQTPTLDSSFRLGFASIDELGAALHHNPQQANAPDLPQDMLNKIASITKIIAPEDVQSLPKPEPHCNCMFCQIARAVQHGAPAAAASQALHAHAADEEVKTEELHFQQWEICQTGEQLFSVVNKLDPQEKYSVFLGNPVGCTCGKQGCEHIIAVLKS